MTHNHTQRYALAAAIGAILLGHSLAAGAASSRAVDVLTARGAATQGALPAQAKAQSGVAGVFNTAALSSPGLKLVLADGTVLEARLQRTASDAKKGTQSWIGTFDDAPGSLLVLSKTKGVVTGFANYKDQTLEIVPAANGRHVMYAVDTSRMPMGDSATTTVTGGADTAGTAVDYGVGTVTASAAAVTHDVLVFYTPAAATAYGLATLQSMITSAVEGGNQAYLNSQAGITVNVVGVQESPVVESGSGMSATLSAFKQNATVRSQRDKLAADMVVLVSEDTSACGQASLQITVTTINGVTTSNTDAYAVVRSKCLSTYSLPHELGHLQGLDHNRENKAGSAKYAYSYGYRVCASDGFRDVMSYACSTAVPRVAQFSNPTVYYNGYATGISYEADPANSAETVRTLNNMAATVAAYRVSSTTATAPAAPTALAVQSALYNSVSIGWTDNASNESGYKVERSPDGLNYVEIASLGAGTRTYTDGSVAASTRYYYRVRAWNSTGTSSWSNAVSTTTPGTPPPAPVAPTSVSGLNNGDGSAAVSWTTGTTTATSFEVKRETLNSSTGTWGSATTVASVPASVLSLVDQSGVGTFRYSVRATNAGGSSSYAGPASVTVTKVTTSNSPARKRKK